ncbi:flagellar biosynthetic protein FliO [Oceanispirochaeta sp.]|jgi:flagellar biosynthetic protein FliO|uniref:FliO/MopB family protein n=1 Tax=Oceanispirochaeta sp. TaxID=2035350 RepID=UPI002604C9F1|nr:flagellar biosynthetic protein FliO [Oceanispirochaeta sp.]MDA3957831.1 flagellar biosynthetic protein FliO [Oceanispirochaeta sp.]
MAQEEGSPQENDFPVINENDLTLFDENPQAVVEDEIPSTVGFSDLVRVTLVLAAVIGVIYLLLYFLKKVSPMAESGEDHIRVLSTRHLKRDSSLHLIEVGNQIFLIGSGSSDVNLISEITDQETLDQIHLDQEAPPSQGKANFSKLLRKGLSLGSGRKIVDQSPGFLRSQRDRLKDLGDQS